MDSLPNLISAFLASGRAENLTEKTLLGYRAHLTAFSEFVEGTGLEWSSPGAARAFLDHLRARDTLYPDHSRRKPLPGPLSPATVRGYARVLRRFSRWLVEEEYFVCEPWARLKLPKAPKVIPRGVSEVDFQKMLASALSPRDRALLLVLRDTGCRASEVCSLRLDDLHLERGYAIVRGKGGQDGFVFFTAPTARAFREWLAVRPGGAGEWVFCLSRCERGGRIAVEPLKTSTLQLVLKRIARRAGVTGRCNAHSFRHAFARDQLLAGNNLATVSDLLRHSDVNVTKMYAAYSFGELQAAHDKYSTVRNLA